MNSIFFDAHCDTGTECLRQKKALVRNSLHLDLNRLEEYYGYIQIFAAFVDQKNIRCSPAKYCVSVLEYLRNQIEQNKTMVSLITTGQELSDAVEKGRTGAILSIEGGEALQGDIKNLELFYRMGVRLITLTWNYTNEIAEGICEDCGGGLTEFGKLAVDTMEKLGIVIDVSHLNERGFWDVAEYTKFPFVASHSNAKTLCSHPRNLSDEQISCIIQRRGCIGINFFPSFLRDDGECDVTDILRHIEYILYLGGEDCVGLGSDFDGISCLPEGICGVEHMKSVFKGMKQRQMEDSVMEKICFGNFYRIFMETLCRGK